MIVKPDDGNVFVLEKGGVAGGAIAHAAPQQIPFTGYLVLSLVGARSKDYRFRLVNIIRKDRFRIGVKIDPYDLLLDEPRSEPFGLHSHAPEQIESADLLGHAGVVDYLRCYGKRAAHYVLVDDQCRQV